MKVTVDANLCEKNKLYSIFFLSETNIYIGTSIILSRFVLINKY